MTKILFICHGNICRSTMAEYVMKHLVEEAGVAADFYIDSAATSAEEIGNGVHHGTRRKLAQMGVPCGDHRARQVTWKDYESFDCIIGMDNANIRNLNRMLKNDPDGKISLLLEWTNHSRNGKKGSPESRTAAFWGEKEQGSGAKNACKGVLRSSGLCDDEMLDYTNRPGEVADPWYTGDFEATYRDVLKGCTGLLEQLSK